MIERKRTLYVLPLILCVLVILGIFIWSKYNAVDIRVSQMSHVGKMEVLDITKGETYVVGYPQLAKAIYGSTDTEGLVRAYVIPLYSWDEGLGSPHYSLVTLERGGDAQVSTFALVDENNKTIVRTYPGYNRYALETWTDNGLRVYVTDGSQGSNTVLKMENYVAGTSTVLYEEKEPGVVLVNVCEYECSGTLSYEKSPAPTVYFARYRKGENTTLNTQIEAKSVQVR